MAAQALGHLYAWLQKQPAGARHFFGGVVLAVLLPELVKAVRLSEPRKGASVELTFVYSVAAIVTILAATACMVVALVWVFTGGWWMLTHGAG